MTQLSVLKVDYQQADQMSVLIELLQAYASDPMGGGSAISDDTIAKLPSALKQQAHVFSLLIYDGAEAVAFANCIHSFSTFKAKPIINIHDFYVDSRHRGKRISQFLLQAIEGEARANNCCKITLEVLEGNAVAKAAYLKFGFSSYELDPENGQALFWEKPLN